MAGDYSIVHETTVRVYHRRRPTLQVNEPRTVYRLMRKKLRDRQREHFYALMLNNKNCLIRIELVSIGSLNASIVHPREILANVFPCERCGRPAAASVILVHNHPSGDPEPSKEDIEFTQRLAKCCELMGVPLTDHVVIGDGVYTSLKETGVIQ